MKETVTVSEAAKLLGVAPQAIRIGIRRKIFPFGQAVPSVTGSQWRYIIPRQKLYEYLGIKGE